VAVRKSDGTWELQKQVSDEQLRSFFKEAKKQADRAEIAAEPEDIDPSDEFKRIVDEALLGPGKADADAEEGDAEADAENGQAEGDLPPDDEQPAGRLDEAPPP
jgi:hypothetical protein